MRRSLIILVTVGLQYVNLPSHFAPRITINIKYYVPAHAERLLNGRASR